MPTIRETSQHVTVPGTLGTTNSSIAVGDALQILVGLTAASTGNTLQDHLEDILSRIGHVGTATSAYSNSATYAVGDEVYWVDGSSQKRFFKRLTAGGDGGAGTPLTHTDAWDEIGVSLHNVAVEGSDQNALDAVLVRHPTTQQIIFTTAIQEELNRIGNDYQNAAAVQALINITAGRLADTNRWRGTYSSVVGYAANDYVIFSNTVYRRLSAGTDTTGDPTTRTNSWTAVTGIERLIAFRLRDIDNLNAYAVEVQAGQNNRGRWLGRQTNSENYRFLLPPMQWRGAWSAGGTNYYGDVVSHNNRTWVLTNEDTSTTGKTGANSEPGRDTDWIEIPTGHTDDIAHYRGEWNTLSGQTIKVGDIVSWLEDWYICYREHVSSSSIGPDDDDTYLILNNFHPSGWSNRFYHAGTTLVHSGEIWFADEQIVRFDPEPGSADNHKWRQITGATQDDLDALRNEFHNIAHGTLTTRGTLVDTLAYPIPEGQVSPVWLPRHTNNNFTAPAAQVPGSEDITFNMGHEPGEYAVTTGSANRLSATLQKGSFGGETWSGVFSRAGEGSPFAGNTGQFTHNPLGSAVMGVGEERVSATEFRVHLVVKAALWTVWGGGEIWIRTWAHDGTEQSPISVREVASGTFTHGGTSYVHLRSASIASATHFNVIGSDTNHVNRAVTIGFSGTATGSPLYLGDAVRQWTIQPPDTSRDDLPVFSDAIHNIRFMTQAAFEALEILEPRTLYLTQRDSS